MKKTGSFIGLFLLLAVFVLVFSVIYYYRMDKTISSLLIITVSRTFLFYIPVIASLSILWPIVFRSAAENSYTGRESGSNFNITVFMFLVIGAVFLYQEAALPAIYDNISYSNNLRSKGITVKNTVRDTTGEKFTMAEFNALGEMNFRSNIAFSAGTSYIYFGKMYDGKGSYYIEEFRFINFKTSGEVDYIITSGYAKIVNDLIYIVNPVYFEYSGQIAKTEKKINGIKSIILPYRASGIFALSSENVPETVSLINILLYNDFALSSGINYRSLGNVIFNRIGYYLILVLMLLISSTFGTAFKNMRMLKREYLQTAVFYLASFLLVSLCYDTFNAVLNLIYCLLI